MRLIAAVFAVLAFGCQNDNQSNLPVNPGGGGPGGGGGFGGDGGLVDSDGGGPGYSVCLLTADARGLNGCAASGAAGFTVTLGSGSDAQTAITNDDGSFTMSNIPSGNGLYWSVTGASIYSTTQALGGASIIPVITTNFYMNVLETDNGVGDIPGDGGVFIKVVNTNGMPIMGATATVLPNTPYGALYDSTSADLWSTGSTASTGADGTIWLPTVLPGTATINVTPAVDSSPSQYIVPIAASTLTMVFAVVST